MNAQNPLLTVFLPAYNAQAYLAEAVESVLSQSFSQFEVIIVDDGSTDGTVAIAQSYAAADSRVRLIRSPHRGEVAARNKALSAASPATRYFLNHDADDISLPGKLEAQIQYLESHPTVAILGTLGEYFTDAGLKLGNPPIETTAERIRATFHQVNSMIHSASVIRREVFEIIGGYREEFRSVDDYDFFMRALLAGFRLENYPRVLHRIRLHDASIGSTRALDQQRLVRMVQEIYLKNLSPAGSVVLRSPATLSTAFRAHPVRAVVATKSPAKSSDVAPIVTGRASGQPQASRKLRILHTVQLYHPHIGGSEEVVKQLSERLVERGHSVTVATGFDPQRDFSQWNGVEVRQFKIQGNQVYGITSSTVGEIEAYQRFLLENRFDVILNYAAQIWSSDLMFPLLDHLQCSKILVPCGYSGLPVPDYRGYFEALPRILQKYDRVVHLSENYRDGSFSRQHGLTNSVVIGNAAAEEEFLEVSGSSFREKYQIQTPYLIITVANHYNGKGHNHLIEWFRQLRRTDTTLAIIGARVQGGCWEECQRSAAGLANVRFFDTLSREDVIRAHKDADLFWFGSDVECFPLVILEAMASRTPWLSTEVGNVADLSGGWVSEPRHMVRKANMLLDSSALREDLGHKGFNEWKAKFTWEKIVDEYERLYLSVVDRRDIPQSSLKNDPLVSVVIPCYNQANYLPDAVESVLQQTYRNFEIIIVDDGSPDNTREVAERLIARHSDVAIRVISQVNQGLAASRNAGIRAARGTHILPLDADDKIRATYLEVCVQTLKDNPALSIVTTNLEEFGDSSGMFQCGMPLLERIAVENQIIYCSLFKKSLWEQVGGYRSNMRWGYEDWDFWIACLERGARIVVTPGHLFLYRKKGASMYTSAVEHGAELQAQIVLNHPGLYEKSAEAWAKAFFELKEGNGGEEANRLLADYYVSRAHWDKVAEPLSKLARKDPTFKIDLLLGIARLRTTEFRQGLDDLRRCLDAKPDHMAAHFLSAIAFVCLDDLASARKHAEDAIELDYTMADGFDLLIAICRAQQDEESANDLLARAADLQIQLHPAAFQSALPGSTPEWKSILFSKYLAFSPAPLLQINSRLSSSSLSAGENLRPAWVEMTREASPLVSVIMPTYNRTEMLVAAIKSVLKQTYQEFEIVVVNDGGVDAERILGTLNGAAKISYVRHDRNRGLAAARNTGIRLARGKYIAYLDDDDLYYPDHLQTLVRCLETNDCRVAYTDAHRAHQTVTDGTAVVTHRDLPFSCDFDHDKILVGNFIPVLCVMHEKSCLDEAGLFDESLTTHEDWDLWIRLSRRNRFGHIRKTTCEFSWRSDGTSMTSSKHEDFLRTLQQIYKKHHQYAAGKKQVLDAQEQYLIDRKAEIAAQVSEVRKSGRSVVIERVQRYIRMGKTDLALKIIERELKPAGRTPSTANGSKDAAQKVRSQNS